VIAYDRFDAGIQRLAGIDLSWTYQGREKDNEPQPEIIRLSEPQVKILDALAEASDIPHKKGQKEIKIPRELWYAYKY